MSKRGGVWRGANIFSFWLKEVVDCKTIDKFLCNFLFDITTSYYIIFSTFIFLPAVKQEVKTLDDEAIRIKEQAILEIGNLFAETKQATGKFFINHLPFKEVKITKLLWNAVNIHIEGV